MKLHFRRLMVAVSMAIIIFSSITPTFAITNVTLDISPIRSYSGVLPSVQDVIDSGSENVSGDWFVWRKPYTVFGIDYDADGCPIWDQESKWQYHLIFVSDDYYFDWSATDLTSSSEHQNTSGLVLYASEIYRWRLESDGFSSTYITDDVLGANAGQSKWVYNDVSNGSFALQSYGEAETYKKSSNISYMLCNGLVASNFDARVEQTGPFYTQSIVDGEWVYSGYWIPAIEWDADTYTSAPDGEGGGESSGDEVTWLQKIYNAIVEGFQNVIDKISGNSKVEDDLQEDSDNAVQNATDIQQGVNDIVGDFDSSGGASGFFDAFGEGSETFEFFEGSEDGEGFFSKVNDFFIFMSNLWLCIPNPIQSFIVMSFSLFMLLAVLKMFH